MLTLFTCLISLQLAMILTDVLIGIPGWVHGTQAQAVIQHSQ